MQGTQKPFGKNQKPLFKRNTRKMNGFRTLTCASLGKSLPEAHQPRILGSDIAIRIFSEVSFFLIKKCGFMKKRFRIGVIFGLEGLDRGKFIAGRGITERLPTSMDIPTSRRRGITSSGFPMFSEILVLLCGTFKCLKGLIYFAFRPKPVGFALHGNRRFHF